MTGDSAVLPAKGLAPARAGLRARLKPLFAPLAALFVRVAAAGLGYLLQVALARMLGAEHYGVFAYAWAWVAIGGFGATFGLSQTAVRNLARYHEDGAQALASGFVRFSLLAVGGGAAVLTGLAAIVLTARPGLVPGDYLAPLLWMLATVPLFALGDLAEGYARSQGWNILALAPPYLVRQGLILIGLPLAVWSGAAPTGSLAMAIACLATAITALVQLALVLRRLRAEGLIGAPPRYRLTEWRKDTTPVFFGDVAQVLRQNADLLILALFVAPREIAIYFAATRVASLLGLIEFAVGATAGHRFARAAESADASSLPRLAGQAAAFTFWPTLAAAGLVYLLAPAILSLFGAAFAEAVPLVMLLAAGATVRALIGPCDDLLIMRGHGRPALLAQAAGLAVTVAAGLVLVPMLGIAGAAIANLAALAITTLVLAAGCRHHLGFVPNPLLPFKSLQRRAMSC